MYSENRIKDAFFFLRALSSNQLARLFPSLYLRLNKETGRGNEPKTPEQISDYFSACFKDYLDHLGVNINCAHDYLKGKHVLEFGPGNILGVALLFYAYGAQQVHCVDRFSFDVISKENLEVYHKIINSLKETERARACSAFKKYGDPKSGFDPEKIRYFVTKHGLSGEINRYDLIMSRAVLEHVNDLEQTFLDLSKALKKGGRSIHQVDLRSHNLDRYKDFDFLTLSPFVYRLMYSQKGYPNRWRTDRYKEWADKCGLKVLKFESTGKLDSEKIKRIHPKLAKPFRGLNQDDISWLGFWMIMERDHSA
jgi:cyclopropane fatty-acyl-phospholipid synthase-like methyltransferase